MYKKIHGTIASPLLPRAPGAGQRSAGRKRFRSNGTSPSTSMHPARFVPRSRFRIRRSRRCSATSSRSRKVRSPAAFTCLPARRISSASPPSMRAAKNSTRARATSRSTKNSRRRSTYFSRARRPRLPPTAKFGTNRLGLGLAAGPAEEGLILQATLFDAMGNHLPFKPDDIRWVGLPETFELIKYSCFRESLCIELPERLGINEGFCSPAGVMSRARFRTRQTLAGRIGTSSRGATHTCALTVNSDIHCWGDNRYGQLRATPTNCPASVSSSPSDCSTVPLPIQCGPGEVCKFVSLSAGGERTCAVDTAGKLWCWGSAPDPFSGAPVPVGSGDKFNGEVQAFLTEDRSWIASSPSIRISRIAVRSQARAPCIAGSSTSHGSTT